MEVYFKDLISEEATLEKLVDDLLVLVHRTDDLAEATGAKLPEQTKDELLTGLERVKKSCRAIKEQAIASARGTDRMVRKYPYSSLGVVFGLGLLIGLMLNRK